MPIPQGWKDVNNELIAPNGKKVVLGFRQHIIDAADWDGNNLPVENEVHCDVLEHGNHSIGAGQRQLFRWSGLGYTTGRGVYEMWIGQELSTVYGELDHANAAAAQAVAAQKAAEAKAASLQAELDTLKASHPDFTALKTALVDADHAIQDVVAKL